jgi:DNA-binding NarL/FixJ family response regulator
LIEVLVVDDHPAVRVGLMVLLRSEPGIVPIATAAGMQEAIELAQKTRPEVALVDYELGDGDGLALCYQLKADAAPPGVLIYSAFARDGLSLAARAAGADGLLDKGAPPEDLFGAIRALAGRRLPPPAVVRDQLVVGARRLQSEDLPILGMLLDGAPRAEIAAVLRLTQPQLDRRVHGMLARLATPARSAA